MDFEKRTEKVQSSARVQNKEAENGWEKAELRNEEKRKSPRQYHIWTIVSRRTLEDILENLWPIPVILKVFSSHIMGKPARQLLYDSAKGHCSKECLFSNFYKIKCDTKKSQHAFSGARKQRANLKVFCNQLTYSTIQTLIANNEQFIISREVLQSNESIAPFHAKD